MGICIWARSWSCRTTSTSSTSRASLPAASPSGALNKLAEQDPEGVGRVRADAEAWNKLIQETFMTSYTQAIAGCPSWPAEPAEVDRLLKLFLLEKVLYEIRYEVA